MMLFFSASSLAWGEVIKSFRHTYIHQYCHYQNIKHISLIAAYNPSECINPDRTYMWIHVKGLRVLPAVCELSVCIMSGWWTGLMYWGWAAIWLTCSTGAEWWRTLTCSTKARRRLLSSPWRKQSSSQVKADRYWTAFEASASPLLSRVNYVNVSRCCTLPNKTISRSLTFSVGRYNPRSHIAAVLGQTTSLTLHFK